MPLTLIDNFPLRTTAVFKEYYRQAYLPYVYGVAWVKPVRYDKKGVFFLLSDSIIASILVVRKNKELYDNYVLEYVVDSTGKSVSLIHLGEIVNDTDTLEVLVSGTVSKTTGLPMNTAYDIISDIFLLMQRDKPAWLEDIRRVGYLLGGVVNEVTPIRNLINNIMQSIGYSYSQAYANEYGVLPPNVGDIDESSGVYSDFKLKSAVFPNRLVVNYYKNASLNAIGATVTLRTNANVAIDTTFDYDAGWLRFAKDAINVGSNFIKAASGAVWEATLTTDLVFKLGGSLSLNHIFSPVKDYVINGVTIDSASLSKSYRLSSLASGSAVVTTEAQTFLSYDEKIIDSIFLYDNGVLTVSVVVGSVPLKGASVTLDGTITRESDDNGNALFFVGQGKHSILIRYTGYTDVTLEVTL